MAIIIAVHTYVKVFTKHDSIEIQRSFEYLIEIQVSFTLVQVTSGSMTVFFFLSFVKITCLKGSCGDPFSSLCQLSIIFKSCPHSTLPPFESKYDRNVVGRFSTKFVLLFGTIYNMYNLIWNFWLNLNGTWFYPKTMLLSLLIICYFVNIFSSFDNCYKLKNLWS